MTVIDVYNLEAEKTSQMELNEKIFGAQIRGEILHQVVVSQMNRRRSGTASTKSRSEIKASGKKLWRQKGTGRARVGDSASPTRKGGGVALGPKPRKYLQKVPKKVKKAALAMALSDKFQSQHLVILEHFDLPGIKTREFVRVMKNFEVSKALIVTEDKNVNLEKSSRNVPGIKVMKYQGLNVYDVLKHDYLFLLQPAITGIEEALIS